MARRKPRKSFDLLSAYNYYVPGGGGVCMLLLMMIIGAVLGNLVVVLLTLLSMDFAQTYGMLISYPLMFIPAMLYASAQSRKNELFETGYALDNNNFGRLGGLSSALAVSIATLALAFIMDSVNLILPPMPDYIKALFEKLTEGPLWVTFISVSIFAPFFEEWLCRGMILRGLLQKMKPIWAITVSALVFALIHLNPWQGLPAFALGLLFGYVYYKTGSLKLTMLMHFINNTFSTILSQIDRFKEAESFFDVLSTTNYIILMAACILMTAYFIYRMYAFISIPLGQRSACEPLS
ncbi:MAG: lysostaphin resistance A-like protein [Candidatus Cryptobacteroides sp.]